MSDTKNVKLGVCRVYYNGADLGYTKGGVEVEVTTETHKVTVDQFGESVINEYIQKRDIRVTVPLAETTLENMVAVMPGATLIDNGTKQVSTVDIVVASATASQTDTVTIDGVGYSFTSDVSPTEGEIALGLVNAINADPSCPVIASTTATAADAAATVVLTARVSGDVVSVTVSANLAVALTTAAAAGAKRVDVSNGIGTDLLAIAKQLVLHPKGKALTDKSEDFIIPLAATAGALTFAYKFDEERIFNVEFMGYPDPATELLFKFGDPAAA